MGIQHVNLLPPMPGNDAGKSNGVTSWSMVVGMMVVEPDSAFAAGAVTTAMGRRACRFCLIVEDKAQLAPFFQKVRCRIEELIFECERCQIIRTRCTGLDLADLHDGFG